MARYMTRNPYQPGASNLQSPVGVPIQFLEVRYDGTDKAGPQEWIYAPDGGRWAVTMYFMKGAGSAFLEGTDETPGDLARSTSGVVAGNPPAVFTDSEHTYPITDTVTDTTRVIVEACTGVRVNILGGVVDLTARC